MPYGIDDKLWRMLAPDDQAAIASRGRDTTGGYADKVSQYDAGAILAATRGSPRPADGSRSRGSTVSGPTRATGGKGPESKGAMATSRGRVVPPTRANPITVGAVIVRPVYTVVVFWVDEAGRVHVGPRVGKGRIVAPSVRKLRRQGIEVPGLVKGEAKKVVVPIGLEARTATGTVKPTPGKRKPPVATFGGLPLGPTPGKPSPSDETFGGAPLPPHKKGGGGGLGSLAERAGSDLWKEQKTAAGNLSRGAEHVVGWIAHDVREHPEHAAAALAVAAVLATVLGPEAGVFYLRLGADVASIDAGVKASQGGRPVEAALDFASSGFGTDALNAGRTGKYIYESLAPPAARSVRGAVERAAAEDAASWQLTPVARTAVKGAVERHRNLVLLAEKYEARARRDDAYAAFLSLLALDPSLVVPSTGHGR